MSTTTDMVMKGSEREIIECCAINAIKVLCIEDGGYKVWLEKLKKPATWPGKEFCPQAVACGL